MDKLLNVNVTVKWGPLISRRWVPEELYVQGAWEGGDGGLVSGHSLSDNKADYKKISGSDINTCLSFF